MMIAARNAFLMGGAKLPYDAEVEWLDGGGGYVDTGVYGAADLVCDARWSYASASSLAAAFGARSAGPSRAYAVTGYGDTADRNLYVNFNTTSNYLYFDSREIYKYSWTLHLENGNSTLWRDAVIVRTNSTSVAAFTTAGTLLILGYRNGDTIMSGAGARVHYLRLGSVRDLIPVRVGSGSSAVGYLYDRANPTGGPLGNGLYGNAADGQGGEAGFPANCVGPDK
jgi:hypothetical protein